MRMNAAVKPGLSCSPWQVHVMLGVGSIRRSAKRPACPVQPAQNSSQAMCQLAAVMLMDTVMGMQAQALLRPSQHIRPSW